MQLFTVKHQIIALCFVSYFAIFVLTATPQPAELSVNPTTVHHPPSTDTLLLPTTDHDNVSR